MTKSNDVLPFFTFQRRRFITYTQLEFSEIHAAMRLADMLVASRMRDRQGHYYASINLI